MTAQCTCFTHMGMRDPDPSCLVDHRPVDEQITELAEKYQWAIRGEHHKDRDCHFAVSKVWSYGDAPTYRVEHQGYLHEWDGPSSFPTARAAHEALRKFLEDALADVKTWDE